MTQEKLKELLDYNEKTGEFRWKVNRGIKIKIGDIAGTLKKEGYVAININYKLYYAHRLAWLYVYGKFPEQETDHINQNRSDNRVKNLRAVTCAENGKNQLLRKNNVSGISGVYWNKGIKRWIAQIWVGNKTKSLGSFTEIEDAKQARDEAKVKYGFHPNHA